MKPSLSSSCDDVIREIKLHHLMTVNKLNELCFWISVYFLVVCVYKVLFTLQLCRPCRHSAERLHSSEAGETLTHCHGVSRLCIQILIVVMILDSLFCIADVQLLTVNNEDCSFSLCCLRSELCRRWNSQTHWQTHTNLERWCTRRPLMVSKCLC